MSKIAPYLKALVAALVAGLGSLYQALDADQAISTQEWIAVAMTTLAALGAVFAVPNKDPQALHQAESVQPPERGATDSVIGLAIGVLLVILLVVVIMRLA
jgi:hypothetical protein